MYRHRRHHGVFCTPLFRSSRFRNTSSPMHPSSHLLQLVPARVKVALDRINGLVWHLVYNLTEIEATEARVKHRSFPEAAREPLTRVSLPQHWGMLWDQR